MGCVEAINSGEYGLNECSVNPIENGLILFILKGISRINGYLFHIGVGRRCVGGHDSLESTIPNNSWA
jgi:hypothetical protein